MTRDESWKYAEAREAFGLWVRRLRKLEGLSQEELATRLDVTHETVIRIEGGDVRMVSWPLVKVMATLFRYDSSEVWRQRNLGVPPGPSIEELLAP
ncbi:MAG: helix-turn-helix transcriptional regulator [Candidatus Uhrbacteria bacterium]|nr:helix-turn-helix transcriptional regulator [Candidatus Uhrbacteria bacterium]MDP3793246.1 helix-turn-helix transcriptional regulator [Candidatus Uhrbacteria bacterium]